MMFLLVKYAINSGILNNIGLFKSSDDTVYKHCAREAALAAAKKWNPGLTLEQQKPAVLQVADTVYNEYPVSHSSLVGKAIPGIDIEKANFGDAKLDAASAVSTYTKPEKKIIEYSEKTGSCLRIKTHSNSYGHALPIFQLYDAVHRMEKDPQFVLEDIAWNACCSYPGPYPYITLRSENLAKFTDAAHGNTIASQTAATAVPYKKRKLPEDTTVQISINNDRIQVLADNDVAFAVPAKCNVDIVLTIPTNGAASNVDNRDGNSASTGSGYGSSSTTPTADAQKTPIYQIAQAYRTFLKENFLFTRGVNVGLVPYSGNCSLPTDRLLKWTEQPKKFLTEKFLANAKNTAPRLKGAFLYGTMSKDWSGSNGQLNYQEDHHGISANSITNIMCRTGKFTTEADYGENILCHGDLLSTANPANAASDAYSPKYRRKPAVNCYICYANLLSMKNEKDFPVVWHSVNPYHVVELQADVMRICDLLNLFYPFNLPCNSSNFIFIGPEWANNLFQSWTNDPKCATGGQLSRPSKTTSGRKKALIMLVNKPDWFEPQELTYLGF
ncbi:MAG: hypothetical protein LBT90_01255, partial [Holosporaceae bacterium]|nr:hypothetical protein [Holosporaceae bacterium]